jgi:hypothetical protein
MIRTFKKYFDAPWTAEYKLKTPPKGYQPDHQDIEYLKLKSFTFSHALKKIQNLLGSNAVEEVCNGFIRLHPFIAFLRNAVS